MKDKTRKKLIRTSALRRRRKISLQEKIALDKAIAENVLQSFAYQNAETVLCYVAMPFEVDTTAILESAFDGGKAVALPECNVKNHEMHFRLVRSFDELTFGAYGIFEPLDSCALYEPTERDLCIVPGLSFDRNGNRIGFGGGYYDRYLSKYPVRTAGLCYDAFVVPEIPSEPFDIPVQMIITQSEIVEL